MTSLDAVVDIIIIIIIALTIENKNFICCCLPGFKGHLTDMKVAACSDCLISFACSFKRNSNVVRI